MRVLQVGGLAGPGPVAGGVWAVAQAQQAALRRRGMDVSLVGGWHSPKSSDPDLIPVRELFPGAGLRGLYSSGARSFVSTAASGVDVVHIHLSRDHLTTTSLAAVSDAPVVVQPHGMISPSRRLSVRAFDLIFKGRMLKRPTFWLTLTSQEEEDLREFGVDPSRIRRISNGVDDALLRGMEHREGAPSFLFLSRMHARKHPEIFIDSAVRYLNEMDGLFVLAGPDQGMASDVRDRIEESGRQDAIRYVGALERQEAAAALRASDIVVLPSRGEVAPMVAIEAAAAGKALIITRDCGIADAFWQADAAVVVDPNVPEVSAAMRALASDRQLRRRLGSNARKLFESRWSLDSLGAQLESIYREAANRERAR